MKRFTMIFAALMAAGASIAQTDTTTIHPKDTASHASDTVRIGRFVIIKNEKKGDEKSTSVKIESVPRKPSNVSTNWWIFDLGFANLHDETNYASPEVMSYLSMPGGGRPVDKEALSLRRGKTSNVNLWFFMQRLNLAKGYLNLKYGLGVEMFNFRYENNISYRKNPDYIFMDSINFSKNKLYAGYLSVPFMLNLNTHPGRKKGLSLSAGVSAGYLVGSRNKQISNERGKEKLKGDLGLEQFRLAYIGELGLGRVRLFGSYSMTPLHETGLKQYPFSLGIRFSNW